MSIAPSTPTSRTRPLILSVAYIILVCARADAQEATEELSITEEVSAEEEANSTDLPLGLVAMIPPGSEIAIDPADEETLAGSWPAIEVDEESVRQENSGDGLAGNEEASFLPGVTEVTPSKDSEFLTQHQGSGGGSDSPAPSPSLVEARGTLAAAASLLDRVRPDNEGDTRRRIHEIEDMRRRIGSDSLSLDRSIAALRDRIDRENEVIERHTREGRRHIVRDRLIQLEQELGEQERVRSRLDIAQEALTREATRLHSGLPSIGGPYRPPASVGWFGPNGSFWSLLDIFGRPGSPVPAPGRNGVAAGR